MQCIICDEEACINCSNGHNMCKSCFGNQVKSQTDPTSVGKFIEQGSQIICSYCKDPNPFSDRIICCNIDDPTYEQFIKVKADLLMAQTQEECEKRFAAQQQQSKIDAHRSYVCENVLTLHCPNPSCKAAVLDFDGCFAIECSMCKKYMCG